MNIKTGRICQFFRQGKLRMARPLVLAWLLTVVSALEVRGVPENPPTEARQQSL